MSMSMVGKIALSASFVIASVATGQTFTYSLLPSGAQLLRRGSMERSPTMSLEDKSSYLAVRTSHHGVIYGRIRWSEDSGHRFKPSAPCRRPDSATPSFSIPSAVV